MVSMKIRKEFIVGVVASIAIAGLILGFFFLKERFYGIIRNPIMPFFLRPMV